jgi:hypothetical protein
MTTLETLDLSSGPNTGLGDPLRDGGSKINNNFDKIFVLARVLQENTLQVNKAIGNANINILEVGDIVSGWFTSTLFLTHAVYNGGTVGDIANYSVLGSYDFS